MSYIITSFQFTEKGARSVNEDCVKTVICGDKSCFILCDGLGGHASGEIASQLVCSTIEEVFQSKTSYLLDELMQVAINEAQTRLIEKQRECGMHYGLKTTLCCLMISADKAVAAYVGDSRIYWFRNRRFVSRTLDHSVVQHLVTMNQITDDEMRQHEDRNKLLRVMGIDWDEPQYQMWSAIQTLQRGDSFLLCSDGLWEWFTQKQFEESLTSSSDPESWANSLKDHVETHGIDTDNYSGITIMV